MTRNNPTIPWCRYADDALAHCKTEQQAQRLLAELKLRFEECGLRTSSNENKDCLLQRWQPKKRISQYRSLIFWDMAFAAGGKEQ